MATQHCSICSTSWSATESLPCPNGCSEKRPRSAPIEILSSDASPTGRTQMLVDGKNIADFVLQNSWSIQSAPGPEGNLGRVVLHVDIVARSVKAR